MQDGPLNAYVANKIDEVTFTAKNDDLKAQQATVEELFASIEDVDETCAETALQLFDWGHKAADLWGGSNNAVQTMRFDAKSWMRVVWTVL